MIRSLVVAFVLVISPIAALAQTWQTFERDFTGQVGGHKISGRLVNKFGVLMGEYYYDKYKAAREKLDPRDDIFTIFLEGTQRGSKIELEETCYRCEGIKDPEHFVGKISKRGISGSWSKASKPHRVLSFEMQFEGDTLAMYQPPTDLDDLAQYEGKNIWASGFFSSPKVQRELAVTLGRDLRAWKDFLTQRLARTTFSKVGHLVMIELWQEDDYSDLTFIALDPSQNRIYVAWRGSPENDPNRNDVVFYGDDCPEEFAKEVLRDLTESWGHAYDFTYAGKRVLATLKKY